MKPLAILMLVSSLVAQETWTQPTSSPLPPYRSNAAMAYDSARGVAVLFGGLTGTNSAELNDTWEWDGKNWAARSPVRKPTHRSGHAMAYDSARRVVVLFGGYHYHNGQLAETWEWDGSEWTLRAKHDPNSNRINYPMVYDPVRRVVLRFGGGGPSGPHGDTWAWDGATWLQVSSGGPRPRTDATMAFDAARGRVVLFGGNSKDIGRLGDTWEWDGASWTERFPVTKPPTRTEHTMAWHAISGRCIVYGGYGGPNNTNLHDTWGWDGVDWTMRAVSGAPGTHTRGSAAYDEVREQIVLFGGNDLPETWLYSSPPAVRASFATFGGGCGGPALVNENGQLPWIGAPFTLRVNGLPASPLTVLAGVLGISRTQWGALPLPLDLGPFGMPGCKLYVSMDLTTTSLTSNGSGTWSLGIPPATDLAGVRFYVQSFAVDLAKPPLVAVWSNAGEAVIGRR